MEHKTFDARALLESYRELLPQVDSLPLEVTGSSMAPFLVPGRDTVRLSAIRRPLRVGDIVLYQRGSGEYILHRICRTDGHTFTLVGDAHTVVEPGIRPDQIFALVTEVTRKQKKLTPGSFWWEFFEKIWVRIIPLRPWLLRRASAARKIIRRNS